MALKYVITGCGGSATGWGYRVARGLGSACGHQTLYTTKGPRDRPELEGDSSWCAVPHLDGTIPVLWLVRDPLTVVRSLSQLHPFMDDECADPASRYVKQYLPGVWDAPDRLGRILRYINSWDRPVENSNEALMLPVDRADPAMVADRFTHILGRPVDPRSAHRVMTKLGNQVNTHRGDRSWITWRHITKHPDGTQVVDRAERLGYR